MRHTRNLEYDRHWVWSQQDFCSQSEIWQDRTLNFNRTAYWNSAGPYPEIQQDRTLTFNRIASWNSTGPKPETQQDRTLNFNSIGSWNPTGPHPGIQQDRILKFNKIAPFFLWHTPHSFQTCNEEYKILRRPILISPSKRMKLMQPHCYLNVLTLFYLA